MKKIISGFKNLIFKEKIEISIAIIGIILTVLTIILTVFINASIVKSTIIASKVDEENFLTEIQKQNEVIESLKAQITQQEISNEEARKANTLFLYKDLANIILTQPEFASLVTKAYKSIDGEYMTADIMSVIEEMEKYAKSSTINKLNRQFENINNDERNIRAQAIDEILLILDSNSSLVLDYLDVSIEFVNGELLNQSYGYNNMLFIAERYSYIGAVKGSDINNKYNELIDAIKAKKGNEYSNNYYLSLKASIEK